VRWNYLASVVGPAMESVSPKPLDLNLAAFILAR